MLVPDGTRSCSLPLLLSAVHEAVRGRVSRPTVLVALGTHAAMSPAALARHLGHPEIAEIGYRCRDFFVERWERYRRHSWGVLAHSTHLRGAGTYDAASEQESVRVTVTPAVDPATLVVPSAGEVPFRLT